jgi:hypothetical protein
MKSKQRISISLLVVSALVTGSLVSSARAEEINTEFRLTDRMSVAEFETEIQAQSTEITYLEFKVQAPGDSEEVTFGTLGSNLSLDKAIAESLITLQDQMSAADTTEAAKASSDSKKLSKLAGAIKAKNFEISAAEGKSKKKLKKTLKVPGKKEREAAVSTLDAGTSISALAAPAVDCGIWRPNFHENKAAPSSFQGQRYNQLKFAFTQGQLDAFACTGSTGFEPDFVTYNYDGFYYFGSSIVSFSSSMPFSYLDTNFMDAPEERVYTVGTYKRSSLEPWTQYNTYIRTGMGNTDTDKGKVVWQRNSMNDACFFVFGAAWCSFMDDYKIDYAWKLPLPGTFVRP